MPKDERRRGLTLRLLIAGQIALAASIMTINLAGAQETAPARPTEETPATSTNLPAKPAGGAAAITTPVAKPAKPHIDLAFCIDTTGSMQGEIDEVKTKVKEIVAKLSGGKPSPIIRVGMVAFRDRHDDYVTKVFPFTEDIDQVVKDISNLQAHGGGDAPEAVASALHDSVHTLKWDASNKTLKLLFVIGDAGPNSSDPHDWQKDAKDAIANGIQINTIGCDGLQRFAAGSAVFKEIARLADGKFEFLSYKSEVAQADGTRATIVHAAGKAYKMKSADATAWRAGAKDLEAKGIASEVASAPGSGGGGAVAGRLMHSTTRGAYFSRRSAGASASTFVDDSPAEEGGYATFSRRENNLADMVLGATKQAANKKLQMKFEAK
jgi:hypothetical protein